MVSSDVDPTFSDGETSTNSTLRWSLLGLGGVVSLCCLVAPTMSVATGMTAASSASAAVGGSLVRILVAALTVGVLGVVVRLRADTRS